MFQKKKRYAIDELNAYKVAYGRPIAKEDYFLNIVLPALFGGGVIFLLLNNVWLVLVVACFYAFYGYRVLFPLNVKRFYSHRAFDQRNRLINNLTQLLSDPTMSWFVAFQRASERCEGELRQDIDQLLANLQDASSEELSNHFRLFGKKYETDVVFSLFMEQIETIALEGRTNIMMIQDIKNYHNQIREKTKRFVGRKKKVIEQIVLYLFLSGVILEILHFFPLGYTAYLESFAHSPIGWVMSGVYLCLLTVLLHKVCQNFYDDEIMEVKI
ncbi:hypothetical protein IHP33_04085 [Enterococcus faecalis]|uniref:hypothetical protein n=1 Tax=Enterococcus faecalis TaxID=1351 RepID=UPI00177D15E7|nr:hypothetical protein [Enterococcus faecalis]MBD9844898.1 hypothetical protein [Enterococcus faecalis]